jgi:hypothetical protein
VGKRFEGVPRILRIEVGILPMEKDLSGAWRGRTEAPEADRQESSKTDS